MSKTKSEGRYIVEFPLSATSADKREVHTRLSFLRQLYNAVLSQLLSSHKKLIKDPAYKSAMSSYREANQSVKKLSQAKENRVLSKHEKLELSAANKVLSKIKSELNALNKQYNLSEYYTHSEVKTHVASCCFKHHLDSHTTQKIASRAFAAFNDWRFCGRGRPRFKSWKRSITSAEGKSQSCIRVIAGCDKKPTRLEWKGLSIPLRLDKKDNSGYQADALELIALKKWKYCRIIEREVRGKTKLYAQVIFAGKPFIKRSHRELFAKGFGKTVGLDHGPSTIAAVSEDQALLQRINKDTSYLQKSIAKLQRKQSRRLMLKNSQNYSEDTKKKGRRVITTKKIKKGSRNWIKTDSYLKDQKKIRELHRLLAEKRKQSHNTLANEIIGMGNTVKNEKLSHKALQKMFGKSVGSNAPSALISTIQRKAENAGGEYIDINPWKAKLSQYDHVTDCYKKKSLSERVHFVGGKIPVQRDLYSAFLALCTENNVVSRSEAERLWNPQVRHAIENAEIQLIQTSSREALPSSLAARELKKLKSNQSERFALPEEIQVYGKGGSFNAAPAASKA